MIQDVDKWIAELKAAGWKRHATISTIWISPWGAWYRGPHKAWQSLLHRPNDPLPGGCYCKPGQCMAPVMMGRQMPCRDPEKAQGKTRCCDNGYFGEAHDCQKSNPEAAKS